MFFVYLFIIYHNDMHICDLIELSAYRVTSQNHIYFHILSCYVFICLLEASEDQLYPVLYNVYTHTHTHTHTYLLCLLSNVGFN